MNEEYMQAFRTKSYMELCNKAQRHTSIINTLSSSSSLPCLTHLTEYLLEPRQETITMMTQTLNLHHLLIDYFDASLHACHFCDKILQAIHQARLSYQKITRVVKLSNLNLETEHVINGQTQKAIYTHLASFSLQNNPFSMHSFQDIHNRYMTLLNRLRSKGVKIRRRVAFKRVCLKIGGFGVIISQSAIVIALLVLALHSIVGIIAAPSVVAGLVSLFRKRTKWVERRRVLLGANCFQRLYDQLDVAAKGVFILMNDFDTMSRMVKHLENEVEHWKEVADMCLKNGKCEKVLKKVLREFSDQESGFLDQLEELEEHVYLCFLTVNRFRQMVIQEIVEKQR